MTDHTPTPEVVNGRVKRPYTLIINRFDSRCGHCGENTLPTERRHTMVPSRGENASGCGVVWVFVDTEYAGLEAEVTAMRPDLTPAWEAVGSE